MVKRRERKQRSPQPEIAISATSSDDNGNHADHRHDNVTTASDAGMEDEYGEMTNEGQTYTHPTPFVLESGETLANAKLRYMTYGTLDEKSRDNVLVVCHALTGNASLHAWWGDLLGSGKAFDTDRYFVVCCNLLGSCYGSTSPISTDPTSPSGDKQYGIDFPDVSVRDSVRLQLHLLRDHLALSSVKCVVGGSFGGMQVVEYAAQAGAGAAPFVRSVIPIACGTEHSAWQIAVSEAQRQAIYADPKWRGGRPTLKDPANGGLRVARQIGMISYRTSKGYDTKFGRRRRKDTSSSSSKEYGREAAWQVKSYLEYQGDKILTRFDPITYVKLTEQMDSHDVGRGRGGKVRALANVRIPAMVLGIDSDVLYPLYEQEELATLLPNGELNVITSDAGHDGFLLEQDQVAGYITRFLNARDSNYFNTTLKSRL